MNLINTLKLLKDLEQDSDIYHQMFGPETSVDILNKFDGYIFCRLQYCLIDRILLGLARFMDPPESKAGKLTAENLSLRNLIDNSSVGNDLVISRLLKEISEVYDKTGIKDYRNKVLSHNDKDVNSGLKKAGVSVTPNEISELIRKMTDLILRIADASGETYSNLSKVSLNVDNHKYDGIKFIEKLSKSV